jgi:hypothetical protein
MAADAAGRERTYCQSRLRIQQPRGAGRPMPLRLHVWTGSNSKPGQSRCRWPRRAPWGHTPTRAPVE